MSDIDFDSGVIRIKHSKRAKRLALRLDPKERVINLVVPNGVSMRRAHDFARYHGGWIDAVLHDLPPLIPFEHDRVIPILGADRKIDIQFDENRKSTQIELTTDALIVRTNKEDPSPRIERFLKNLAKEKITEMVSAKALDINKPIKAISIRDTKSRWGSCSADGKLSFSWRLIFAPTLAMDYVAAHEVAHRIHMDHSKKFWALCEDLSIDYREGKYWMNQHAQELMRYGGALR